MPYGKINLVGLALIAAVLGGLYWVIFFAPLYVDNLDVKEALSAAVNQAEHGSQDDNLRSILVGKLAQIGSHKDDDGYGTVVDTPGLGVTADDIDIERDPVANTVKIGVRYDREVQLKPSQRVVRVHFNPVKEGSLSPQ